MAKGTKLTSGIDWNSARERLTAALRRTEEALEPSSGRADLILKERARALATPAKLDRGEEVVIAIHFAMRGTSYLIESRYVVEVLRPPPIAPVPRAADFLIGIINIRGELVPIFDLPIYFGLAAAPPPPGAAGLAVLGEGQAEYAILVDWIEPATPIMRETILTGQSGPSPDQKYIRGLTADGRHVLDGEALLSDPGLFIKS